jgi:hypothetical protein
VTAERLAGTVEPLAGTVERLANTVEPLAGTAGRLAGTVERLADTVEPLAGTVGRLADTVDSSVRYALRVVRMLCGLFFFAGETSFDHRNSGVPLAGPKFIRATGKDGALFVRWTKVASAPGVVPYDEVCCGTSPSPAAKRDPGTCPGDMNLVPAEIPGLGNCTLYYVRVKAVFPGLGVSGCGPVETGTPLPPPAPPSAIQAVSSEKGMELAWTAGQDAFLYEVRYAAGGGGAGGPPEGAQTQNVASTGAFVSGLGNNVPYRLWVRSANTNCNIRAISGPVIHRPATRSSPARLQNFLR